MRRIRYLKHAVLYACEAARSLAERDMPEARHRYYHALEALVAFARGGYSYELHEETT